MKVLILDKDTEYVKRLEYYLGKYASEMHILHFDSCKKMNEYMERQDFDIVLCGEAEGVRSIDDISMPVNSIPFAWLSKKNERVNDQNTIFKYQSVINIYDQLCDLYESVYQNRVNRQNHTERIQDGQHDTSIIAFFPVHGGAGSSVMAISCAQRFSETNRVLYINLEEFGCESYFISDNKKTFSDIIAELKGKYTKESLEKTLDIVMCSDVNVNANNLSFIKSCKNAVDITYLTANMLKEIIKNLRDSNKYDYIIIDASMVINDRTAAIIQSADKLVFSTDASDDSNYKLKKVQRYVQLVERQSENKADQFLIYNKFYSNVSLAEYTSGMVVIGTFGRYRLQDNQQISRQTVVKNISRTPQLFEKLL